jgi:hypothetical protein
MLYNNKLLCLDVNAVYNNCFKCIIIYYSAIVIILQIILYSIALCFFQFNV